MATHLYEHRAESPRSRLAWFASLAVHAACWGALVYVSFGAFRGDSRGSRRPDEGPSIELGLTDNNDEQATRDEIAHRISRSRLEDSALGAGLLADSAAVQPIPAIDEPSASLAPQPRLPLLALGGSPPAPSAAPQPARGPLKLGGLADRATVTVFGAVGEGSRFVYLFDHSISMAGAPLAAAKQQLIASLDALSSVHQFQVIFFNHEVQAWDLTGGQRRIPYASDANKRLAAQFVRGVMASGATDRLTPLRRALAMNADVVFFLTDVDDAMTNYDVAEVIERAQGRGTAIACIEFGQGPRPEGENFLTRIAAATGGDYAYVDATRLGGR
jgi:hypothetical protein